MHMSGREISGWGFKEMEGDFKSFSVPHIPISKYEMKIIISIPFLMQHQEMLLPKTPLLRETVSK